MSVSNDSTGYYCRQAMEIQDAHGGLIKFLFKVVLLIVN